MIWEALGSSWYLPKVFFPQRLLCLTPESQTILTCRSLNQFTTSLPQYSKTKLDGAFGLLWSSLFVQAPPSQSPNQHYPQAINQTILPFWIIALSILSTFHHLSLVTATLPVFATTQPSLTNRTAPKATQSDRFNS